MRDKVLEVLKMDTNPMFSTVSICQRITKIRCDSHHPLYGRVKRVLAKLEKEKIVYVYRHTNQGTTYILRERVRMKPEMNGDYE